MAFESILSVYFSDTAFGGVRELTRFVGCGVSNQHVRAPCRLKIQSHGPIRTGRFFENPLVGRHVENVGLRKE